MRGFFCFLPLPDRFAINSTNIKINNNINNYML